MKEQIKELRVKIDGLAQLTKELKPVILYEFSINRKEENSKEIEKAVDSLYLGKAWLGKVLGELGNENPYGSGYKTKEDIVPTQDVFVNYNDYLNETTGFWTNKNHIEKVDYLRTEIESLVNIFTSDKFETGITNIVRSQTSKPKIRISTIERNVVTHLSEARFHLGFEMERIKNEK